MTDTPDTATPDQPTDAPAPAADESALQAAAGALTQEPDAGDPPAPEPIDYGALKAPEGVTVSDDDLAKAREFAEQNGLSLEAAQGLLARDAERLANFETASQEAFQSEIASWRTQIEKDPELGGENIKRTEQRIEKLLTEYGPEGFYDRLKEGGFLYVPDFQRLLNNIAARTEEPRKIDTGTPVPATASARDFYDNSPELFGDST